MPRDYLRELDARGPARLPLRERRVGLRRLRRLFLDADAVADRELVPNVDRVPADARAGHEDHARPVPRADEAVLRPRGAVHEVPLLQVPLVALDDRDALAAEDEEVLLVHLAVVPASRLARLEHRDRVADLRERGVLTLEDARRAEHVVLHPWRVADVDDEPAVRDRRQALGPRFEPRFVYRFTCDMSA